MPRWDIEIKINDPPHQSSELKALEMYEYDFKIQIQTVVSNYCWDISKESYFRGVRIFCTAVYCHWAVM